MSEGNTNVNGGGIGFCGLLAIVFITLKLTGVIGWSWWWVLAPIWIPMGLGGIILALAVLCTLALMAFSKGARRSVLERLSR